MEKFILYNIVNLVKLPLLCLLVILLYNLDAIGNVFYFIPSFDFIILFYFIILFDYTLMLWVIILLCPDVMDK